MVGVRLVTDFEQYSLALFINQTAYDGIMFIELLYLLYDYYTKRKQVVKT